MRYYDVFNGDADGICALHQLRLEDPRDAILVTGMKRDIALLDAVPAGDGDVVTVLDLSLDRNRDGLAAMLARGAVVQYFDHHFAGEVPSHPRFSAAIDSSGALCTSAIVDRHLRGSRRSWAVAGAFGDGMEELAALLAVRLGLDVVRVEQLRDLGTNLNYAAYGESERDALMRPEALYRIVARYEDPFELIAREPVIEELGGERLADLQRALATPDVHATPSADVWFLGAGSWARRVMGVFANGLAEAKPKRAHAVLAPRADGAYMVSVRAPRGAVRTAVDLCRRFPTGGGRVTAAGIDRLDPSRVRAFVEAFDTHWRENEEELA